MGSNKTLRYLLMIFLMLLCMGSGPALGVDIPSTFAGPRIRVVDLTANRFSDKRVLVVSGNIENLGDESIQGHVIIYLKNGVSVITAMDAPVNNGSPIAQGAKGYFELTTNIGNLPYANDILVEFVSNRLSLQIKK